MIAGSPGRLRLATRAVALALALAFPPFGEARAADSTAPPAQPPPAQPLKPQAEGKPPPVPPPHRSLEPIARTSAVGILGSKAEGPDGDDMGLVVDVVVDRDGRAAAVVIDFGGFLGVGSRKIAIDWRLVRIKPGAKSPVRVRINRADLEAAPEYDATAPANQMIGPVIVERPEPPDAGN